MLISYPQGRASILRGWHRKPHEAGNLLRRRSEVRQSPVSGIYDSVSGGLTLKWFHSRPLRSPMLVCNKRLGKADSKFRFAGLIVSRGKSRFLLSVLLPLTRAPLGFSQLFRRHDSAEISFATF